MTYFECDLSAEPSLIGRNPQLDDVVEPEGYPEYKGKLLVENWGPFTPPPLVMSRYAKLTDFLSSLVVHCPAGLIVSPTAKELLHRFHLPQHRWLPLSIHPHKGSPIDYWILNYVTGSEHIIYPASTFYDRLSKRDIHLESFPEWIRIATENKPMIIYPRSLVLGAPLDLLVIPGNAILLMSEALVNEIQARSMLGLEFSPSDILISIR